MTSPSEQLDYISIEPVRRQTRPIAIKIEGGNDVAALNDDFLRVASFQGEENISHPYQFNLELHANSVDPDNPEELDNLASLMGRNLMGLWAQVRISMPYNTDRFTHKPVDASPSWEDSTPSRFFRGIISSVSMGTPGVYQLSLQAPLFPLTLRNRYHIYKDKNIKSLLTELLVPETANNKCILDFRFDDSVTLSRVQDWLQAGESDFEFLQRVIQKASIHFYFIHYQDTVTLVFSNRKTSPQEVNIPNSSQQPLSLRYSYSSVKALAQQQGDLFCELRYQVKMIQQKVRAVLTRSEAQWEDNTVAGFTSYEKQHGQNDNQLVYQRHRSYAYGTNEDETQGQLKKVCQQLDTEQGTLSGVSTSPLLSPGYTFELNQPAINVNLVAQQMPPQFSGKTYVVTKIQHKMTDTESYSGTIEATEVSTESDDFAGTFITPFAMQNTQQGSVLAKVLQSAVPKGWRYREKNNFQPESGSVQFGGDSEREKGCLVRLATAQSDDDICWVRLSQSTQTAPEVGAMVQVSRANNESELPEISVIASHGSKTIQPPDRRNESWTANTSWGSNYSTSYGDGISIRFGHYSPTDLTQAKNIVESAFDNPDMSGNRYKDCSFSRGGSFSFSSSDQGDVGILGASVSQGSSYNESHAATSYGFSDTNTSQSYSQVGKSVNCSVIGEYSGAVDFNSPSFINGKVPEQSIITIADSLDMGDTYSESHIKGKTINLNGTGAEPPAYDDTSATVFSSSKTVGKVVNKSETIGNTHSTSETTGDTNNQSKQTGNITSSNEVIGDTTNISTNTGKTNSTSTHNGDMESHNTVTGKVTNVSTNTGNMSSTNTVTGDVTNTSTNNGNTESTSINNGNTESNNTINGNVTSYSTNNGDVTSTSTNNGDVTSTSTNNGDVNSTSTHNGAVTNTTTHHKTVSSTTNIYASQISNSTINLTSSSSAVGLSNSNSATGLNNSNSATGLHNNNSATGLSMTNSLTGVNNNNSITGVTAEVSIVGASVSLSAKGAASDFEIIGGLKIKKRPSFEAQVEEVVAKVIALNLTI